MEVSGNLVIENAVFVIFKLSVIARQMVIDFVKADENIICFTDINSSVGRNFISVLILNNN